MKKQGRPNEYEEAIISIIKGAPKGTHLTAPEVFAQAKELGLPVSISTVYRTLQRLKTEGNISTVSGDRKLRYESVEAGPEHDHLICLGCGLTIEFIDERLPQFGQIVAKRKGYEPLKSRFDILGYCRICSKNTDEQRRAKITEHWQQAQNTIEAALNTLQKFAKTDIADEQLWTLITENEHIVEALSKALDDCQAVDKLLNRDAKSK